MKRILVLLIALLLIVVPFGTRADDNDILYESEVLDSSYVLDDYYEDDEYYYDESYVMEADDGIDLDNNTTGCEKKLFTADNIIFLAVGVVVGAALTIVAVVCTKGRCTCDCQCDTEEKKIEKKTKKSDK